MNPEEIRGASSAPYKTDSFSGRTVLITGAGQGIGRRYAHRFAELGAAVVVADIQSDKVKNVASEVVSAGGKSLGVEVDVSSEVSVADMVRTVQDEFGSVDVLINNAAMFANLQVGPFEDISLATWETVLRINVTGAFLCSKAVSAVMREQKYGRIINVSSTAARQGAAGYLHYITSKEAVIGMTRGLARELGPDGITVNALLPAATLTEVERQSFTADKLDIAIAKQSIKRPSTPDDLADVAIFLGSDASSFVSGQSIIADGGVTFT